MWKFEQPRDQPQKPRHASLSIQLFYCFFQIACAARTKRTALTNAKKAQDHTDPEGTARSIGSAMVDWSGA
jgi:hypothetical protein